MLRMKLLWIMALLTTSCTLATLFIGHADYFLAKKIGSGLDLSREQRKQLEGDIGKWLNSIKPQAQRLLERIEDYQLRLKNQDTPAAFVIQETQVLVQLVQEVSASLSPVVSNYMTDLKPEQWETFWRDWDKQSKKLERAKRKRDPRYPIEKYEEYLGRLSDEQLKIFHSREKAFLLRGKLQLERRQFFSTELHKGIQEKWPAQRISDFILRFQKSSFENTSQLYAEVSAELFAGLSDRQRSHFSDKLDSIAKVIRSFIKEEF